MKHRSYILVLSLLTLATLSIAQDQRETSAKAQDRITREVRHELYGYSPSNRSIARTDWLPPRHENLGRSPGFYLLLKLLASSVVRRRNVPPFSKVSK